MLGQFGHQRHGRVLLDPILEVGDCEQHSAPHPHVADVGHDGSFERIDRDGEESRGLLLGDKDRFGHRSGYFFAGLARFRVAAMHLVRRRDAGRFGVSFDQCSIRARAIGA